MNLVFDDCGGRRWEWLCIMVMELEMLVSCLATVRLWVLGPRAGGLNWVVGVEVVGKVVAAVHCGGGWEVQGQGWWVWV